jgi:hypothetical protein
MKYAAILMAWALAAWTARAETAEKIIHDFTPGDGPGGWAVEDDGVMGGLSKGGFTVSEDGHGVFSGEVSLENNGGFSSVQCFIDPIDVSAYRSAFLRIKGDGKRYRFLVEAEPDAWHYYEAEFPTSGEWETVEIPFDTLVPVRRGDRLDKPNFPGQTLAQIRVMIANGTAESFRLEIDRIWLR